MLAEPAVPASTLYMDQVAANLFSEVFMGTVLHPFQYGDFSEAHRVHFPSIPPLNNTEKQNIMGK